jgi:hypothetical protein
MLTVSDDKFPYWDGTATTPAWAEFPGNKVILRLERRNTEIATLPGIDDAQPYNFSFDNNYTLISAGHESLETFVVRSTGQVKIGRRAILYRSGSGIVNHNDFMLCVDGKIVASEIVILCNNDNSLEGLVKDSRWQTGNEVWPDFVFSSSYNLMPLNELENKINNNKHLPGIPPASEIAKNGINLGEFQSKLLQKIEELTLYIINLNKENETLKKRIHKLEKKRGRR